MSRSGYSDDFGEDNSGYLYRGAVKSAIEGKRGQAFLKEMLAAMDALPEKKLIAGELEINGAVCAMGAVGKARGLNMQGIDSEDAEKIASMFGIAAAMAREISYENDEYNEYRETPEARFVRMRNWIIENIKGEITDAARK